jgi:hypothetical protein
MGCFSCKFFHGFPGGIEDEDVWDASAPCDNPASSKYKEHVDIDDSCELFMDAHPEWKPQALDE